LRSICIFISITALGANYAHLAAQQVTTVAPPAQTAQAAAAEPANTAAAPSASDSHSDSNALPNAPGTTPYPDAVPIPPKDNSTPLSIEPDPLCGTETIVGSLYVVDCKVVVTYGDRVLHADHIEYDSNTGDVTMTGHVVVTEGENDLRIEASHGTINIRTQTGRFYDVSGSVGLKHKSNVTLATQRAVYANGNPFLFTGRTVMKTGPRQLQIYGGTVTSCQLASPDWLLSGGEFSVDGTKARATNTVFRVRRLPVFWLPYVTHPVDTSDRQTGILIPEIGFNSAAKGSTIGEQVYWAINRSTDLTVGSIFYSARGYEQTASFRYRGLGQDFVKARYSGLQDRGYFPGGGSVYVNQSGTDLLFSGRHDLSVGDNSVSAPGADAPPHQARIVADVEYLSSFPYREAFSSNFNQAVSSEVVSTAYATRDWNGMAASLEADRYQGEKRVATKVPLQAEEQVHIFHAPALEFATTDHPLGSTGLLWNLDSSLAALKRSQPNFATGGMIERLDLRPELAYPIGGGGWRIRPSIAGRETFYSRSRFAPVPGIARPPIESTVPLNRANVELRLDLHPPVLERTFDSGFVEKLLHHDVKHTIEPEFNYRFVRGIGNFANVLRFDAVDVASDTNEIEYGVTQRLFLRPPANTPCRAAGSAADATELLDSAGQDSDAKEDPGQAAGKSEPPNPICGSREWISWRVAQKYFFDPNFGGAVDVNGPRSILQTTLDFSGIAFLTGPRNISPLTSRLRVRTSAKLDVEWDFDFDTCSARVSPSSIAFSQPCEKKFTSNNVFVDVHQGDQARWPVFGGISYARLDAPARSYVEGVLSSVADFNQMRVLFGFGKPTRAGPSAAAYAGLDLDLGTVQYGAVQVSYNWNCCGVSVEYRKYELGTARNDNGYKFNFTLANIGSAGNLRHADQVF
jgi:LPS-assembly protein